MTVWKVKNKDIKDFLEDWVKAITEQLNGEDLLVTNHIHGSFWSPSKKYKFFRTAGFAISKDSLKGKSISPFLKSIPFAFYFMPKNVVKHE